MDLRRAGRLLLDFLLPLYSLDSTPERRHYCQSLPMKRIAKLLAAIFFTLSGVGFRGSY